MKRVGARSSVWRFTMAFTGVGSTMLGPFLPQLLVQWRLHDRQAGMLVACLFLGSFMGTLLLSPWLDRSLRRGAWAAAIGCALFGWSAHLAYGFAGGMVALVILGFGMGQLMSSINLLVGAAPVATRSRELAGLSAAWCTGAVLSPCLTTVLANISPSLRITLFAALFLLPLIALPSEISPALADLRKFDWGRQISRGAVLCTIAFLIYGGIEASIGAWIPVFATRYSSTTLTAAQWTVSLFWCGLIAGRSLIAWLITPSMEPFLLRSSLLGSSGCLLWLLVSPSLTRIIVGSALLGVCVSPLFPLLLSTTLSYGYATRVMGVMLASCAIGSAFFPLLLGTLSGLFSLRIAMALPLLGLLSLIVIRWNPPRHVEPVLT